MLLPTFLALASRSGLNKQGSFYSGLPAKSAGNEFTASTRDSGASFITAGNVLGYAQVNE